MQTFMVTVTFTGDAASETEALDTALAEQVLRTALAATPFADDITNVTVLASAPTTEQWAQINTEDYDWDVVGGPATDALEDGTQALAADLGVEPEVAAGILYHTLIQRLGTDE